MRSFKYSSYVFMVLVLAICSACTSVSKENEVTATEQPTNGESHSLLQSDAKPTSHDFISANNRKVQLGGCSVEIPQSWDDKSPYYYAEYDEHSSMLYVGFENEQSDLTSKDLVDGRDSYLNGFANSMDDSKILSADTITINGITMNGAIVDGKINGQDVQTELYWFIEPKTSNILGLVFGQSDISEYDHFDDFHSIVKSVICTEDDKQETSIQTNTNETVEHSETPKSEDVSETAYTPTTGEINALKSAKSYLNYSAFSYSGLIEQLEYEGYSKEEATYAVDNCGADWKDQALKSAKSYLNYSAFSYSGLIEQLEYEGFSKEEATYAVDNCGADWNEQAAKSAKSYLNYSSFSRSGLIDQLLYEGFTYEQAEYGVTQNGY